MAGFNIPFNRARFTVERGEYAEPLKWSDIPAELRPNDFGDLRGENGKAIVTAFGELAGEKLFPIFGHIGKRPHVAGVYGNDFTLRGKVKEHHVSTREEAWIREAYFTARRHAKQRGIDFQLSMEELNRLVRRSRGKCEVTGIEFSFMSGGHAKAPWKPSIDRTRSDRGYCYKNCRIVCCAANIAMNDWGLPVLDALARAYVLFNPQPVTDDWEVE